MSVYVPPAGTEELADPYELIRQLISIGFNVDKEGNYYGINGILRHYPETYDRVIFFNASAGIGDGE